jgi:hypothetical protein
VVEVLEAVHLILAVRLFIVVVAVDPRWLLQSLRLHYDELLRETDGHGLEEAWQSTPLHYLEKIIQVPFALRAMNRDGVRSLVDGLLPLERSAEGEPPAAASGNGSAGAGTAAAAPAASGAPARSADGARPAAAAVTPPARAPSLSPRTLALTRAERDFAALVAGELRTPRTVKKFTNLYRLLRAGIDEHSGALDRFLAEDTGDAAEYQAVLIMLVAIIAFPDEAPVLLLALARLDGGDEPDRRSWADFVDELGRCGPRLREASRFLAETTAAIPGAERWTRDPFRRWAVEVSRYSFATGQEVFARAERGR